MALTYEPFDTVTVSKLNEKLGGGVEAINGEISDLEAKIPNIFVVKYGITTYQEIEKAITDGKTPILFKDGYVYSLYNNYVSGGWVYFINIFSSQKGAQFICIYTNENNDWFIDNGAKINCIGIDCNDSRISSVKDPSALTDAATKNYVDTKTAKYLPLSGGDITNSLTVSKSSTIDGAYFKTGYDNGVYSNITEGTGNGVVSFSNEGWGTGNHTDSYVGVRGYNTSTQKTQGVDLECLDGSPLIRVRGKDSLGFVTTDSETATSVELTNVSTPTQNKSVANKQYVDTTVANYLPLSGGTLTGNLTISKDFNSGIVFSDGDGINNIQNTARGLAITSTTGLLSLYGRNGLGTCRIENVTTPTSDTDAANKKYVDDNRGDKILIQTIEVNFSPDGNSDDSFLLSFPDGFEIPLNKYLGCYFLTTQPNSVIITGQPAHVNGSINIKGIEVMCYNVDTNTMDIEGNCYIVYKQ